MDVCVRKLVRNLEGLAKRESDGAAEGEFRDCKVVACNAQVVLFGMKLNLCPSHVDAWSCTGVEFVCRLIVESLRILHLRLFGFNPGAGFDDLQISVAHGERNYVERVLVAELGGLFGGARR